MLVQLDVSMATLTFSDGTEYEVPPRGVTFVVGGNNSGKSSLLREAEQALALAVSPGPVLSSVTRGGSPTKATIRAWLLQQGGVEHPGQVLGSPTGPVTMAGPVQLNSLMVGDHEMESWSTGGALGGFGGMVIRRMGAEERLQLAGAAPALDQMSQQHPTVPLQAVQADFQLEQALSRACELAFGEPLTLPRVTGPTLSLKIGKPSRPFDVFDADYVAELAALPGLEAQGDGYRAFVGILLAVYTGRWPILLVDEPEAFLHPPQARKLGRELASHAKEAQVVCATHSADVLEGALASGENVSVLRVVRDGGVNHATHLGTDDLKALWADPLVRYCGALDGLFARGLVICEGDRDCTFYLAALDSDGDQGRPDHDLEFVSVGGKDSIPRVAAAMVALGVSVQAICDIDVLNDEAALERIVGSLGGELGDDDRRHLRVLTSAVDGMREATRLDDLRTEINESLDAEETSTVSRPTLKALQRAVRRPNGWTRLKEGGLTPLRGEASKSAKTLIASLAATGLQVVPCGELEGWVPDAGSKGTAWLSTALAQEGHKQESVRMFTRQLLG